jgi:hypothetical protein
VAVVPVQLVRYVVVTDWLDCVVTERLAEPLTVPAGVPGYETVTGDPETKLFQVPAQEIPAPPPPPPSIRKPAPPPPPP